jgi:hypothetical protein
MGPLLVYAISAYHICVYLWGVFAACFYFCNMLFNIIGNDALRVLAYLSFSVYMGWIYFVGLGISCGYTWRKELTPLSLVLLVSASLSKLAVSLLAFTEVEGLFYFISAFNLAWFLMQLLFVYHNMQLAWKSSKLGGQSSHVIYSEFIVVLRWIFGTLSLLFGIECMGTYMVYGDGMEADNAIYFACFAATNSCVQSMLMWVARPK